MSFRTWRLFEREDLTDGRVRVTYSLGPAVRHTVVLLPTANEQQTIQQIGDYLQVAYSEGVLP